MNDRWDRVALLFEAALALPPAERVPFVTSTARSGDIRDEVLSLLAAHDDAGDFLERPATAGTADATLTADAASEAPTLHLPAPDVPLMPEGTILGPYRIGPVLGRGGMGVVYLAEDTRLHRRVALKSLSPHLAREPQQRERLKQEARAAAALAHPGIATVYALEEFGDQLFIISEYLEGETLRAEMERGPLPIERVTATALEIARTLCVAHERGIVHRDLKPENIVRTTTGTLKILDFGLAQFEAAAHDLMSRTRLTEAGMVAGTPPYMSPEQLLGRETDSRSDQFAFGVLLYELCTGRHPFGGRSLPSTIAHILATEPQAPRPDDTITLEIWRVVERCLQKDPADRFPSTRMLVSTLEGSATDRWESPASRPASSSQGTLKWWRFHQFAAAMAYWAMVWPVWHVHRSFGRAGLFFFFATLAAVVVAGNLRLHLWFSSRVYPEDLPNQRADVARWIRWADAAFAALLILGGIALPEDRAGWAALLISFGIGSALAALFIEPATTRAAFRTSRS
jgi:predicted Ser/Thr protein kinase